MKTIVKLYGTLSKGFPGYRHSEGLELEVPENTEVKDLLTMLGIEESRGAVVSMGGRILKKTDPIERGNVHIFQAMQGG